jgi:hypothetical protein
MKNLLLATAVVMLLGSTAMGGWYAGPVAYQAYYAPAPVYACPPQAVAPVPYVAYSPVVAPMPYMTYAPVVVPAPVYVGRPVVVGPAGKVYIPGRPVRNAVRAVLP